MGELIPFRRRRPALPRDWARYIRPKAFSAEQIRLTIWIGLLLGLLGFEAMPFWPVQSPAAEPPFVAAFDPYAEAKRSRAILNAQERAPLPLEPAIGNGSAAPEGYVRVIDGDTFFYAGARIRIADIDTPEAHGRCPEESALAAQATRRLEVLLAQGSFDFRHLPSGRERDRYGRKLRIVTRDGASLGDMLVAEGLARTWTGRREPWCG